MKKIIILSILLMMPIVSNASFIGDTVTAELTVKPATLSHAIVRNSAFSEFKLNAGGIASFNVNVQASSVGILFDYYYQSPAAFTSDFGSIRISDLDWQGATPEYIAGIININAPDIYNFETSDITFGDNYIDIKIGGSGWIGGVSYLTFDIVTQPMVVPLPAAIWLFVPGLIGLFGFAHRIRIKN